MEMLTSKELQTLLQVDRSTIYRMAEAGRLPAIKVGKQWRFPKKQVDEWLQTQGSAPAPAGPAPQPQLPIQPIPSPGTTSTNFADMFPLECVQLIQNTFADALKIMVVITDLNGRPVTEVSNPCGLFAAISNIPDAVEKCIDGWRDMAHTIDLEPKFSPSHLGLMCARAMIRVGPELKGMVFVGGIAPENWPPSKEQVQAVAAEFNVQSDTLAPHLTEVFYLDTDEQGRMLSFVQRMANIVAHIIHERNDLGMRIK